MSNDLSCLLARGVLVACLCASACGDNSKREQTAGPDYQTALHQGRAEVQARAFDRAVLAFEAALAARPDDAAALSELSWAAFEAGQLDKAESAARAAADRATSPALRGASLYTLGRVAEARGDLAAAVSAYRESLTARPDRVARDRLAALDPVQPRPLDGPYASLEDYCAKQPSARSGADTGTCGPARPAGIAPVPPLTAMALITVPYDEHDKNQVLAVQTPAGWFVLPGFASLELPEQDLTIERVDSTHGRLLIRHIERAHERAQVEDGVMALVPVLEASYVTVCGVGSSGEPACVGPILTRLDTEEPSLGPSFHVVLEDRDHLTIRVHQANGADETASRAWVGSHALRFP